MTTIRPYRLSWTWGASGLHAGMLPAMLPATLPTPLRQHWGNARHECQLGDAYSMFPFRQQTGCKLSRVLISPQ